MKQTRVQLHPESTHHLSSTEVEPCGEGVLARMIRMDVHDSTKSGPAPNSIYTCRCEAYVLTLGEQRLPLGMLPRTLRARMLTYIAFVYFHKSVRFKFSGLFTNLEFTDQ